MDHADTQGPAQKIAAADARPGPCECGEEGARWVQRAPSDEIAGENQNGFVRNGKSNDAKRHQEEQRSIAVRGDPGEHPVHCSYDSVPSGILEWTGYVCRHAIAQVLVTHRNWNFGRPLRSILLSATQPGGRAAGDARQIL